MSAFFVNSALKIQCHVFFGDFAHWGQITEIGKIGTDKQSNTPNTRAIESLRCIIFRYFTLLAREIIFFSMPT